MMTAMKDILPMWHVRAMALGLAMSLTAVAMPAGAEHHNDVRRAVEAGEIRPLADILRTVREKLPGEIAGVEVERKNGVWLYEFRVIDAQGRLFEAHVDARTGEIARIREK
jgi:uncharacterized membrane protein YkoI